MLVKILIVILLLGGLSTAKSCDKVDTFDTGNAGSFGGAAIGVYVLFADSILDSLSIWGQSPIPLWTPINTLWGLERDTTRYYIKEIKQKCDTVHQWVSHDCRRSNMNRLNRFGCRPACSALVCVPKITCVDDTVWAEKVQVWLTPEQLEQLTEIIKERKARLDKEWRDALLKLRE